MFPSTIWRNTSHLTSKWRGTFNIIIFNVENSIKREMRKNCFSKKKNQHPPPPPPNFFFHQIFFLMLEIAWNMKKNMKKKFLKFYFFQYLKNSYKIQTTFHQYQKLYSTPPWLGARTCKVSRKYSNAFLSYSAKTKRDGQTDRRTDGRTDGRTGGVAISPVPGLRRRGR